MLLLRAPSQRALVYRVPGPSKAGVYDNPLVYPRFGKLGAFNNRLANAQLPGHLHDPLGDFWPLCGEASARSRRKNQCNSALRSFQGLDRALPTTNHDG